MQDTPTSSIKVRSTNVTGNVATSNGGGIYAQNMNLGEYTNVRFDSNLAGAGTSCVLRRRCAAQSGMSDEAVKRL